MKNKYPKQQFFCLASSFVSILVGVIMPISVGLWLLLPFGSAIVFIVLFLWLDKKMVSSK
jgi:hypothetical protein